MRARVAAKASESSKFMSSSAYAPRSLVGVLACARVPQNLECILAGLVCRYLLSSPVPRSRSLPPPLPPVPGYCLPMDFYSTELTVRYIPSLPLSPSLLTLGPLQEAIASSAHAFKPRLPLPGGTLDSLPMYASLIFGRIVRQLCDTSHSPKRHQEWSGSKSTILSSWPSFEC